MHEDEDERQLSQSLNILPGLRWVVDGPPWPAALMDWLLSLPRLRWVVGALQRLPALMGWLLTGGAMFALMVGVEGRLPVLSQQYTGPTWGDLCLGFAYAVAFVAARRYLLQRQFHVHPYEQWWRVAFAFVPFLLLTIPELLDTYTRYGEANITTWEAWLSSTKLYHTFLLWLMGYLFLSVIWPVLVRTPNTRRAWVYRVLIIAGLLGWAFFAIYYDNTHLRPDAHCVHVGDGWWWQRPEWWRGFAGCVPRS